MLTYVVRPVAAVAAMAILALSVTLLISAPAEVRAGEAAGPAVPAHPATQPSHVQEWAFSRIRRPIVPVPHDAAPVHNPIDAFVLAKLEEKGLTPAPPAGRLTLLRRAYFDLLGLPPPPEEVERFAKDEAPDAYEKLIDRLLGSPAYGERWGRHWLDVVRYADTGGFENDLLYNGAWQYRDYVIRSLNADKPFDRFIEEQVAGDELWPDDRDAVTATALYCVGPTLPESAMNAGQLEYEWLTDAADTTGAAFLGLTLGCARCHDHKYDPLTQKDYYGMQAVFAASDRPYPEKVRQLRIKGLNGLLSDAPIPADKLNDPRCTLRTEKQAGFRLFHRDVPMEVRRLVRGELGKPREVTPPMLPAVFTGAQSAEERDWSNLEPTRRRSALARWLVSRGNPLVARVLVNRVWGWHFGFGIVRTPNDFGAQGEPPTHPELLDSLAADFMDHGWSLKRLHRQIMLSRTYQMQSAAVGSGAERGIRLDPDDRLLWHFPRHRLEGEAIRDDMLACAGTLNPKPFGPPVVPPLSAGELTGLFDAKGKWPVTKDAAEHTRRSVYVLSRRTFVYPLFAAFDAPELMNSCPRRIPTVVPTQALALMNSPLAREQAAAFARRLMREAEEVGDPEKIVQRAWLLAFGRPVTPREAKKAAEFLRHREEALSETANGAPATRPGAAREAALAELCLALFNANEFVYPD